MGNNRHSRKQIQSNRKSNQNSKHQSKKIQNSKEKDSHSKAFSCRICRHHHALSKCSKFLQMNIVERIRAVRKHQYCFNCLAHKHSEGHCLSKTGCHHCKKRHHTFLHVNPRLRNDLLNTPKKSQKTFEPTPEDTESKGTNKLSKPEDTKSSTPSKDPTLSQLLRQNIKIILPTALALIESPRHGRRLVRCLLDTGSQFSRISSRTVEDFGLCTLTLEDETICPLKLISQHDQGYSIDGIFKVENRITLRTPTESLPASIALNYKNLLLADPNFYDSRGIDVIIGVDIYPQIISEGTFSNSGLPPAFSTSFGWVVFGKAIP